MILIMPNPSRVVLFLQAIEQLSASIPRLWSQSMATTRSERRYSSCAWISTPLSFQYSRNLAVNSPDGLAPAVCSAIELPK